MKKPDVLIGGAGIIGCALALRLAEEKLSVLVVDKGRPGEEASWAAAGVVAPPSPGAPPGGGERGLGPPRPPPLPRLDRRARRASPGAARLPPRRHAARRLQPR